jgi:hypothetical protein
MIALRFLKQLLLKISRQIHFGLYPKSTRFSGEFGQECFSAIPYAYFLHNKGILEKTISTSDTKPFYYFSNNHEELNINRCCADSNPISLINATHDAPINSERWLPPPYKHIYQNSEFIYKKPTLIIANKYNSEWGQEPVNYFDLDMLRHFFAEFGNDYQIIYNRYLIESDDSSVHNLGDYEMIKHEFPEVISMVDLHKNTAYSYNELQLRVYANCNHFISVQGGASILASYFGGINCIYAKQGFELTSGEFDLVYPLLSQAKINYINFNKLELEHIKLGKLKIPHIRKDIKNDFMNLVKLTIAQSLDKVNS